jgi:hypothetical protein
MSFCRRQFLFNERGYTGTTANLWLKLEDYSSLVNVYKNKILRKLSQSRQTLLTQK